MAGPSIETFETNIADEIRHKEASLTQIASASDDFKKPEPAKEVVTEKHTKTLFIVSGVLILCAVIGILVVGYLYAIGKIDPFKPSDAELQVEKERQLKPAVSLATISPTLDREIGRYVSRVQKDSRGILIEINSYPSVFAYMLKNEDAYADELAKVVSVARNTSGEKREIVNTASTTTQTSDGTTTVVQVSTSTEIYFAPPFVFTDVTISSQNMRIANSDKSTVVYAFLGTKTLAIASSTDGILGLRSKAFNTK